MDYIEITEDNLEKEHICCAISNNKDLQVASKKAWMRERLKEGLVFRKGDIRGKSGLTIISSPKKQSFLSEPRYLAYKGFQTADKAEPYFSLLYLPFSEQAAVPKFKDCARVPRTKLPGFVLYYTAGCPFTAKYVPVVEQYAVTRGIPFTGIRISSREEAQNAPAAWTNYALFYNGEYLTNEIQSEKKFEELCENVMGR